MTTGDQNPLQKPNKKNAYGKSCLISLAVLVFFYKIYIKNGTRQRYSYLGIQFHDMYTTCRGIKARDPITPSAQWGAYVTTLSLFWRVNKKPRRVARRRLAELVARYFWTMCAFVYPTSIQSCRFLPPSQVYNRAQPAMFVREVSNFVDFITAWVSITCISRIFFIYLT